jgi:hypothetical protein
MAQPSLLVGSVAGENSDNFLLRGQHRLPPLGRAFLRAGTIPPRERSRLALKSPSAMGCGRLFWGRKMKNQIVVAIKNQFAIVLIVGGGIIIAPAVFIVALVRLARINVSRLLTKPVSEKLGAILRAK